MAWGSCCFPYRGRRMRTADRTWLACPLCGGKTRLQLRGDTVLLRFPLFCPKCRRETLVNVQNRIPTMIQEPDEKTQRS